MRLVRAVVLWLHIAGTTLLLVCIVWLMFQHLNHMQLLAVQTGSMQPVFKPGDAVVTKQVDLRTLQVGQIVSYHSPRNPNELVTHRIVWRNTDMVQTKGDYLTTPDPKVRTKLVGGRVITILPGFGRVIGWVKTFPGIAICVYAPAISIAIAELRRLERHFRAANVSQFSEQLMI